jgi:hypothetical protein
MIAEGCGWALGIEGGSGIKLEPYWNESIKCKLGTLSPLTHFSYNIFDPCSAYDPLFVGVSNGSYSNSLESSQGLVMDHCSHGLV